MIEPNHPGTLVISLDFELYWGVRPERSLTEYRGRLLGVRNAIPRMLDLFRAYEILVTWAAVGFLFFNTKEPLLKALPACRPGYAKRDLSPYPNLESIGACEADDPLHEARQYLQRYPDLLFQEWIEAPEVSIDAFISVSGRCTVRVPRLRDQVRGGKAIQTHTIRSPVVSESADRVLSALNSTRFSGAAEHPGVCRRNTHAH
jgi:hypothetical protein